MQKIVLITGATSGLGNAMAKSLSKEGFKVYATGRKITQESDGSNLLFKYMDVKNNDSVIGTVNSIIEKENRIDILINNAGTGLAGPLEEIPFEDIYNVFETNYFGTIRVIKQVVPVMRKNNSGLIVNTSSIGGEVGLPFQSVYTSSKFAVESLTEALSIELRPFGIKVCLIQPGDYRTNVNSHKRSVIPDKDSPYYKRLKHFFELLENNIEEGSDPEKMGKLIVKVANSSAPSLRYRSGKFFERITPPSKNIIPDRIFERILQRFYNL